MSILVDRHTRVVVQGLTGKEGSFHAAQCQAYGTRIVGGVTPGKGGSEHLGVRVFDTVAQAQMATGAGVSLIFVPPAFVADAVMEAAEAGMELAVVITEGAPVRDIMIAKHFANKKGMHLIGPNCPGIITPGECKIGILPGSVFVPGRVGLMSKSGTLTYEAANQIAEAGLGISTAVGIGGDPIIGLSYVQLLELFEEDEATDAMVLIGEIGGTLEMEAARVIAERITKPVVAFIAGQTAPKGKRMGHAGAIVSGGGGTALEKMEALRGAGVHVVRSPAEIGAALARVMGGGS